LPRSTTRRAPSAKGLEFIARFEGFRGSLYDDPAGHCTIGFGHLVHHGRCDGSEPAHLRDGISRERALKLLRRDASAAARAVADRVAVELSRSQRDSLTSFAFNVGTTAFAESTLLRRLNAGEYEAVPSELNRWVYGGGQRLEGLARRRRAEGELFANGTY
jgi:lysozyme